jgi:CheY-like chemotaxis protein
MPGLLRQLSRREQLLALRDESFAADAAGHPRLECAPMLPRIIAGGRSRSGPALLGDRTATAAPCVKISRTKLIASSFNNLTLPKSLEGTTIRLSRVIVMATNAHDAALPRILLCDDSDIERRALSHVLKDNGFVVDEAGDGDAAIAHVKHRPVDLVLLDLHMPGTDGFDVLSYLQEHRRALPVILLSGMPLNQIQHKIHHLPTHELPPLLIKPIIPEQLLGLVDLQLSGQLPTEPAGE